jgi:hypothetical protein
LVEFGGAEYWQRLTAAKAAARSSFNMSASRLLQVVGSIWLGERNVVYSNEGLFTRAVRG